MNKIPAARVVRGGHREAPKSDADVAAEGRVLRLAPRPLPRNLVWRLMFGDGLAVSAWYIGVILMAFAFAGLRWPDFGERGYDRQAIARTIKSEETTWKEGGGKIHQVTYTFLDERGVEHRGESFTTGAPAGSGAWRVDYRSSDPSQSRIHGMRSRPYSWSWLGIALLICAFAVVLWELRTATRNLQLLRYGVETRGKRVHQRETRAWLSEECTVFTFEYEVGGKMYSTKVTTKRPVVLQDDVREPMIYDPRSPSRATTLDHLPGSPRITAEGDIDARPGIVIHLLILPLVFMGFLVATVIQLLQVI